MSSSSDSNSDSDSDLDLQNPYKHFKYAHYRLGSKPKYTSEMYDKQIANSLELLNSYPNATDEQLQNIQSSIKKYTDTKHSLYLDNDNKQKTSRIRFAEGTKIGGKKYTRRHKKSKRKTRYNKRKNTKKYRR